MDIEDSNSIRESERLVYGINKSPLGLSGD